MLMGRWITDSAIGAMTDVVLIFPGSNTLNYQMKDSDGDDVAKMDPVSLFVFDEEGTIAANSRKVELPMAVNRCSFMMMTDDDGMMMSQLMCNGAEIGSFEATAGVFQIHNTAVMVTAADGTYGEKTGGVLTGADNLTGDGKEYTGYNLEGLNATVTPDSDTDMTDPLPANGPTDAQPRADDPGPIRDSLAAIGLVMSVFNVDGGDGMAVYDQMVPIWHTDE